MGKLPDPKYAKYYSRQKADSFIKKYTHKLGVESLVLFYKLWFTLMDGKTSARTKTLILAALGYATCPVDAIPDIIPILGLTDDAAVLAATAVSIASDITPETTDKAKKKVKDILG